MTNDQMIQALDHATADIAAVRAQLAGAPPPSAIIDVTPGQSVQAVLDAAPAEAILRFAAGVYDGALTIRQSVHLIAAHPPPDGQATRVCPVMFTSRAEQTLLVQHDAVDVLCQGIGVTQQNPDYELCLVQGRAVRFDRCTFLGDPVHGARRGWRVEGRDVTIVQCYADDIFRPGRDTCVIGSWQDTDGLLVDRCYLCGGAETIMFGGADAPSADRIPQHITITGCTLTKNPAWYAQGAQLKTPFELKCAAHVIMRDCVLEYAGVSEGQGAYLLVLTVRNQDGTAPWSRIEDVLIERCRCSQGGGGVNILGHDDQYPSGTLTNVTIRNVAFTEMNPSGLWSLGGHYGSGRCAMFHNSPHHVTLEAITMEGINMAALGYFANTPQQPVGLMLRNWKYGATEYGWKIDGGGMDVPPAHAQISALMPDLTYAVTAHDAGAVGYPPVNAARFVRGPTRATD